MNYCLASVFVFALAACLAAEGEDLRNIRTGWTIPDEGYCDEPYVVITKDGHWLCTLTTGSGQEGHQDQHVVATISTDQGRTWSALVDIEPADGPEASWVMPLVTPGGRVYAFYTYNFDNVRTLNGKPIRADTLGCYAYKYSDDGGRTWSAQRYRLPLRLTQVDRENEWGGEVQLFWGIGKPVVFGNTVYLTFTKVGKHLVDKSEGWVFRSDNIFEVDDPADIEWQMLPEGDVGIRSPALGDVQAEHNVVVLGNGNLYDMYRTVQGHPAHAYSRDGGRTWTAPVHATYTPGGRKFRNPRACPRIWRTQNGRYLFWFHHNGLKDFNGRNPVWLSGGIERDGYIHWSQPEILLYDPDVDTRISYPDLIEQDGRYWVTETQKSVARVHAIDATLLEGLWRQHEAQTVAQDGLLLALDADALKTPMDTPMPPLDCRAGFAIDLWLRLDALDPGQVVLDARAANGAGLAITTVEAGALHLTLSDGKHEAGWGCDAGLLKVGARHHVVFIVVGGPRIISVVVDGVLCDGGAQREFGWGRFGEMGPLSGSAPLRIAPSLQGRLESLRVYGRYLRTSEAVGNWRAGL